MSALVEIEVALLGKPPPALGALVRSLSCVNPLMHAKTLLFRETLPAVNTDEVALSRRGLCSQKVVILRVSIPLLGAGVRLLIQVHLHVSLKLAEVIADLSTEGANELVFSPIRVGLIGRTNAVTTEEESTRIVVSCGPCSYRIGIQLLLSF